MVVMVQATQRFKMFPNLSERHCIISRDSLCSHATVVQSKLVEIHMHVFQGEGRGEQRAGSFVELQRTAVRLGVQNYFCIESTVIKQH